MNNKSNSLNTKSHQVSPDKVVSSDDIAHLEENLQHTILNAPPLEFEWVALMNDGQEIYQAAGTKEEKSMRDVDTKNVKKFVFRDEQARELFGIDLENRSFMILGLTMDTDLPKGKYELVNIRKNTAYSDGNFTRHYIVGMRNLGTTTDQFKERFLIIYPDRSMRFTSEYNGNV